jgi:SulP family sulfate permease
MEQSGLAETIGRDNVFGNVDDALNRARQIVGVAPVEAPVPFAPTVAREQTRRS